MGNPWGRIGKPVENKEEINEIKQEIKKPEVEKVVEKESVSEVAKNGSTPLVLVSEMDAYIHELQKSQPQTLDEVSVTIQQDFDKPTHALVLPDSIKKHEKNYSFRWIGKKKRAIDYAISVVGWTIVNRVLFPKLPSHLFTANGTIERGDAILTFMPAKRAEAIRLRPAQISRERVRQTPVQDLLHWEDRGEGYYKPDLGAAENDNEKPVGISVTPDTDIRETEAQE